MRNLNTRKIIYINLGTHTCGETQVLLWFAWTVKESQMKKKAPLLDLFSLPPIFLFFSLQGSVQHEGKVDREALGGIWRGGGIG